MIELAESRGYLFFQPFVFLKRFFQLTAQLPHLFLKWHAVVFLLGNTYEAARSEDITIFCNFIFFDCFTETGNVFVFSGATLAAPCANSASDFFDLLFGECNLLAGNLFKGFSRVYKKRLAGTFAESAVLFVFGYEPK